MHALAAMDAGTHVSSACLISSCIKQIACLISIACLIYPMLTMPTWMRPAHLYIISYVLQYRDSRHRGSGTSETPVMSIDAV